MTKAVAGIYHKVGFKSIGSLSDNTAKAQELVAQGVNHYLAIELSGGHQKNIDHFDMLDAEGFTMGARFPFNLLNGVTSEQIEPHAHLNGHPAMSHIFLGHEVLEAMTQQERLNTYKLIRTHFPDTPVRTYYGTARALRRPDYRCNSDHPEGGKWQDYVIVHETPKDDGYGLVIHFQTGSSPSFEDFPGQHPKPSTVSFQNAKSRIEMTSPWDHQYAVHINVWDDYTDVDNLVAEMQSLSNAGADWIYLRSVDADDPSEKASATQAMKDAISEFNNG